MNNGNLPPPSFQNWFDWNAQYVVWYFFLLVLLLIDVVFVIIIIMCCFPYIVIVIVIISLINVFHDDVDCRNRQ